jgi:hypothetical protein
MPDLPFSSTANTASQQPLSFFTIKEQKYNSFSQNLTNYDSRWLSGLALQRIVLTATTGISLLAII